MTTTLQQIQDRAVAFSSANGLQSLVADTAEIINRIAADERAIFKLAARENRYYFAVTAAVSSTAGSSARQITTSGLATPVNRILKLVLADGRTANQVDLQDLEAELSPRYYMLGTVLHEVGNDWSAASGVVSGILTYVKRPAVLSTTGTLTQTVTLDDEFADMLELRLAHYLAHKDVGRDQAELQRLEALIAERDVDFVAHIGTFGGAEARRFELPASSPKK